MNGFSATWGSLIEKPDQLDFITALNKAIFEEIFAGKDWGCWQMSIRNTNLTPKTIVVFDVKSKVRNSL